MRIKRLLFACLIAATAFLFLCGNLRAQVQNKNEIVGLVIDANSSPVAHASVIVKNTKSGFSAGTSTDSAGKFYFRNLPLGDSYSFEVSALNYLPQTLAGYSIKKDDALSLLVTLKQTLNILSEVVVVGYSDKKKSELTSAVTTISSNKLKDVTTNDVGSMLQGKVPGLQVVSSSGAPGAAAEVRLRGVSSINASQDPLYVVDGIIGGNFDPNDIETISVLKDAGATAMYGSQANGGVIIVTTKKAKTNKIRFEAKVTSGFRTPDYGNIKMMNSSQLYEYQKELYRDYIPGDTGNTYKIDLIKFYNERPLALRDQSYNWLHDMFSAAPVSNAYFSASGKTEKADYYIGLTYYDEKGTFMNTKYNRINVRANSTYRFSSKLSLTNNINLSAYKGKSYNYMDVYYAYLNMPWDNPYDSLGNPLYVDGSSPFKWWSRDKVNPIHTVKHSDYPYKGLNANYDLVLNWNITPWLTFASSNRVGAGTSKSTTFVDPEAAGTYHGQGFLNEQAYWNYGLISNNLLRFNYAITDLHKISGLAGVAVEGNWSETMGAQGRGLPPGLRVLDVVSGTPVINGDNTESHITSFISQVNYSYADKYFLTASYRMDGSSAFPKNNRYASFPAVSAAWLINNEDFMKSSDKIDMLKLRASWGITGTQSIGASRYLGLFSLSSKYNNTTAAVPYQQPSPNLTWESKYQTNIGVDVGLFTRITLALDVYRNTTKDLLLQVPQPPSVGFETKWDNVGEIVNSGIEIGLNTINITTKDFEWSTDVNVSFNSNKLQGLPTQLIKTGSSWGISQIYRNGGNLYEFYMPKWLGVDAQTGAPLWEKILTDANGNVTGKETTSDLNQATFQESGSALPKFQGSLTSQWRYKNFALSVNAFFVGGNKVYSNNLRFVINDGHEPYYNQMVLPKNYSIWTKPGDVATNPSSANSASSNLTSTRFLEKGDFISIRNIALSYDLPLTVVKKAKLEGITLSLTADNVYTFTKFLGQDPQTTIVPGDYSMPGVSDFKYPNNRQFLFNVNVRF